MRNIFGSLKNLVTAKKEKKPSPTPLYPPATGGDSLSSREPGESSSPLSPLTSVKLSGRSPNGKVARLPKEVRDHVNQWISDGVPLDTITQRLADLGHPGFNHQNISRWKANGYQKWLHHEEDLDEQRLRFEAALNLSKDLCGTSDSTRACEILTTTQLYELLLAAPKETDPERAEKINRQIGILTRALGTHLTERIRRDRLEFHKKRHEDKLISTAGNRSTSQDTASTEQAVELHRSAAIHAVDDLFGINLARKAAGARVSPPAAMSEDAPPTFPDRGSPEPQQPQTTAASEPPPPIQPSIDPSIQSSSNPPSSPDRRSPEPLQPETAAVPEPAPTPPSIQPSHHPLIQKSTNPFPISPYSTIHPGPTQPLDHIPIFDSFGAWISWIPRSGKGSLPEFYDPILFENGRGQPVCWINPKGIEGQPDPTPDRLIALLNADGRITQWTKNTDLFGSAPAKYTLPIRSRRFRYMTAWLTDPPYDSSCGGAVAYDS